MEYTKGPWNEDYIVNLLTIAKGLPPDDLLDHESRMEIGNGEPEIFDIEKYPLDLAILVNSPRMYGLLDRIIQYIDKEGANMNTALFVYEITRNLKSSIDLI
jgi:hypothetical protein